MQSQQRARHQRDWVVSSALVALALLLGGTYYARESTGIEQSLRSQEVLEVQAMARIVQHELRPVADDLRQLVHGEGLRAFVEQGTEPNMERAVDQAEFFGALKPDIDQLRYLSETGLELFRVNKGQGRVLRPDLQDKANRYYFQKAIQLGPGEMYISRFDLNQEHGALDRPYRPMLRFCMPAFGEDGSKRGVYIINYSGIGLFAKLQELRVDAESRIRLLNTDGYWLRGPSSDLEWGFVTPDRSEARLSHSDPDLWEQVRRDPSGQVSSERGIFTWRSIDPRELAQSDSGTVFSEDDVWILGSEVKPEELDSALHDVRTVFASATGLLVGLALLVSWLLRSRRLADESTRVIEEYQAVTLRSIGDGVLATDAQRRVTLLNPVAEVLTGWTQAEAKGRPVEEVFSIVSSETRKPAALPVDKVLQTGEVQFLANHTILIARDGSERPIVDSAAPIVNHETEIIGVVLVFRDETTTIEAARALRESEQRLNRLNAELEARVEERARETQQALATLDATDDITLIFAPDTLRITFADSGAVRQLGYTREELMARTPVEFHPEFNELTYRNLLAPVLLGDSTPHQFTSLHRSKEGREFWVEINLQYIRPEGGPPRFISIARDITERIENQRHALRSQRLESIGTLAGGVAHDLNNALTPILMSVEMLREAFPGDLDILDTIRASALHASDMVRQLLTFARGAEAEPGPVDSKRLLMDMAKIVNRTFPKNIQLETRCANRLPAVLGNATQLHQVLLNLCVNARDAMPKGGVLTLEAGLTLLHAEHATMGGTMEGGEYVVIRVRDTGDGIAPQVIEHIFDPYYTTKGPEFGTGLGLSTVLGILESGGGAIEVASEVQAGTTFTVYLPVSQQQPTNTSEPEATVEIRRGNGELVLVVEDEAKVRRVSEEALKRLGFEPLLASNGAEGLELASKHRANLRVILSDLHMPELDGIRFVRAVREFLPNLPIITWSGHIEEPQVEQLKELGVQRFLEKPITARQLADALTAVLREDADPYAQRESTSPGTDSAPAK